MGDGARLPRPAGARLRPSCAARSAIVTGLGRVGLSATTRRIGWSRAWARTTGSSASTSSTSSRASRPSRSGSPQPGGFVLPRGPHDSRTLPDRQRQGPPHRQPARPRVEVPPGHLLLQTVRSHDQFNTTVYGLDDRYRGIKGGRRVVFVHPDDLTALGTRRRRRRRPGRRRARRGAPGGRASGRSRTRPRAGCAAAYFPEANVLVPLDSVAEVQQHPGVEVRGDPTGTRRARSRCTASGWRTARLAL